MNDCPFFVHRAPPRRPTRLLLVPHQLTVKTTGRTTPHYFDHGGHTPKTSQTPGLGCDTPLIRISIPQPPLRTNSSLPCWTCLVLLATPPASHSLLVTNPDPWARVRNERLVGTQGISLSPALLPSAMSHYLAAPPHWGPTSTRISRGYSQRQVIHSPRAPKNPGRLRLRRPKILPLNTYDVTAHQRFSEMRLPAYQR